MATRQIERGDWAAVLDELSRQDEQGLVTVEVRDASHPERAAASAMPLVGITLEEKGSGQGRIDIMLGDDPDTQTTHTVADPQSLKVEQRGDGSIDLLQIDSARGTTIVRFLSAT